MTRRKGGRGPILWTPGMRKRAEQALKDKVPLPDLAGRFGVSPEWLRKKLKMENA